MANIVAGLIEALEQEMRLRRAQDPSKEPAVCIDANDVAAVIHPRMNTLYVVPIRKLIERLKEQVSSTS